MEKVNFLSLVILISLFVSCKPEQKVPLEIEEVVTEKINQANQ